MIMMMMMKKKMMMTKLIAVPLLEYNSVKMYDTQEEPPTLSTALPLEKEARGT
jgi:hypothetical protein